MSFTKGQIRICGLRRVRGARRNAGQRGGAEAGLVDLLSPAVTGRWQSLTAPANLAASSEVVPDGHGGAWLGPWAYWTGRAWIDPLQSGLPAPVSGMSVNQLVKIPGTGSYWGAGWVIIGQRSTTDHPAMLVYGPQP